MQTWLRLTEMQLKSCQSVTGKTCGGVVLFATAAHGQQDKLFHLIGQEVFPCQCMHP